MEKRFFKRSNKHILLFVVATLLCLSFCACGTDISGGIKLTEQEVKEAFSNGVGILDITTSGDEVVSFSYSLDEVNAKSLKDKDYVSEAIDTLLDDSGKATIGMLSVAKAYDAVLTTIDLFEKNNDISAISKDCLEILCAGKTKTYDNWTISSEINTSSDTFKINVTSK